MTVNTSKKVSHLSQKNDSLLRFKNWRIRSKILIGYALVMVLALASAFVGLSGIKTLSEQSLPLVQMTNNLDEILLKMRIETQAFLIKDQWDPALYESGTSVHYEAFLKLGEDAKSQIGVLKANRQLKDNKEIINALTAMETNLNAYQSNFIAIKDLLLIKGYDTTGQMGDLVNTAASIDGAIRAIPSSDKLSVFLLTARNYERSYLITNNKEYVPKMFNVLSKLKMEIKNFVLSQEQILVFEAHVDAYTDAFNNLITTEKQLGSKTNEGLTYESTVSTQKLTDSLLQVLKLIQTDIAAYSQRAFLTALIAAVALVVFGLLLSVITANIISKPIKKLNGMLDEIAHGEGDLSLRLHLDSKEELGTLAHLFNTFVIKIGAVVRNVKDDTDILAQSAEEIDTAIASANGHINEIAEEIHAMAEGIQNNAAIIQETTASIQELSNSASMISREATVAANNSASVLEKSIQGVEDLNTVVESIQKVQEASKDLSKVFGGLRVSSSEIVTIVALINDVAEQTSLLALNASIEAARAGEHGRGFAVVAEEVRKLSDESKVSAEKISKIIQAITKQIELASGTIDKNDSLVLQSVTYTEKTDATFKEILSLIDDVVYKINVISESSVSQSQISEDMAKAVEELSKVVQDNADMSERINSNIQGQVSTFEEIQASMTELSNLARRLKDESEKFKV